MSGFKSCGVRGRAANSIAAGAARPCSFAVRYDIAWAAPLKRRSVRRTPSRIVASKLLDEEGHRKCVERHERLPEVWGIDTDNNAG
jgi:hypothetical protein